MANYPVKNPYENWSNDWIETFSFWPSGMTSHVKVGKEMVPVFKNKIAVVNAWLGVKKENEAAPMQWKVYSNNEGILVRDKSGFAGQYDNAIAAWLGILDKAYKWQSEAKVAESKVAKSWSRM